MGTPVNRTFDLLTRLKNKYPHKKDILSIKIGNNWKTYSVDQYIEKSHQIAYALLEKGYQKGDKAITIMHNQPEWNFLDIGLNLAGMVHVPVYPTLSVEDFTHIFDHSDAKIIFLGDKPLYEKVQEIVKTIDRDIKIIPTYWDDELENLENLYLIGKENEDKFRSYVQEIIATTSPNEMATIIYTSGTYPFTH